MKCVSRQQTVPSCFGYKDKSVRVCELCAAWFQKALDRYFDVMELARSPRTQRASNSTHRSSIAVGEKSSVAPSSPLAASGTNDECEEEESETVLRRQDRHSTSAPIATKNNTSKPWFSGHLRAMHVNDRLPRKKTKTEGELDGDGETERDARRTQVARSYDPTATAISPRQEMFNNRDLAAQYDDCNDRKEAGKEDDGDDSSECEDLNDEDDIFQMEPVLTSVVKPIPDAARNGVQDAAEGGSVDCPKRQKGSRKSKFSRSASFDFTNLKSSSPNSTASNGGRDTPSPRFEKESAIHSEQKGSMPRQKCFDDSDIVDSRAKTDTSGDNRTNNLDHATVLRFAVYKIGEKESQSLRRTLGFGKANPVLDRYTLELDCSQGIVRVKSVFMHRFWSFHCDAVQHLSFGSSPGTARLVVLNGGQGNQTHELKFANDEEREEFKRAVDTCRSTNLQAMRRPSTAASLSSSPQLDPSSLLGSPVPDQASATSPDVTHQEESLDLGKVVDPEVESSQETRCSLQLFFGEIVVKGTEFPATLLIGSASDNYEASHIWGRIRGVVAVTNFRVLFVPSEQGYVPFRTALQGSVPYIPLFAVTTVQILYPSGRRSKSSRTYSTGLPSILSINCKDVRIMRIQLDGPLAVSDERSQLLHSVISKLADESQRYKTIGRESPAALALASNSPPTYLSLANTSGSESTEDGAEVASGVCENDDASFAANDPSSLSINTKAPNSRKSFGPIISPSPVLQPSSPVTMTIDLSGSFAFSYAVECPSAECDGWNLFADEREFKRQIGGDPTVQPFLKVRRCVR